MFDFFRKIKQNKLKKRLKKNKIARLKFLRELEDPGSTKTKFPGSPPP